MTSRAGARDDDGSSDDDKTSPPTYHKGDTLSSDSKKGKGKAPVKKSPMKTATEPSTRWICTYFTVCHFVCFCGRHYVCMYFYMKT